GVGSGLDGIPDLADVNTVNPSTVSDAQYSVRIDYNPTDKDLIAASTYQEPTTNTSFNGPNRAANIWHHHGHNESETLLWNHTFSPTVLNEARANAAGWRWNEANTNPQEPFGLPTGAIDNIGSANPQGFGPPGPSIFDQWTYAANDTLTKVLGSHMLKFGGEVTKLEVLDTAPWDARPQYNFRNFWDFLNDAPYLECCSNFSPLTGKPADDTKNDRSTILGFFAQDNYKVKSNLTLNYGLRWEYFGPMHEKDNHQSTLVLGSGKDTLTGLGFKLGGNLWQADKADFGPQLGFAWSPGSAFGRDFASRLVLRGGFGVGYTAQMFALTTDGRFNPPFVSNFTSLSILYAVPSNLHCFDCFPSNPSAISTFNSNNVPTSGSPVSATGFPAHFSTPYTEHYSLEAQYDFGGSWVGTLGYQGSASFHFLRQTYPNLTLAGVAPENPIVNSIDYNADDDNGNFNALLADLQHRFAHSFQADASYQWSRCMDHGSQNYNLDQYFWNPAAAYGRCDYNSTHDFKVWGIWSPTIFRGSHSWLEKVAGGWSISEILNAHSGFPWTAVYNNGNTCNAVIFANNQTCNLRPAAYLGGALQDYSNSTFMAKNGDFPGGGLAHFTPPTFVAGPDFPLVGPIPPPPGVGRNSENGPHYFDVDATLTKAFVLPKMKVLGENAKFEIQASFFNLFNSLNLTNVDSNINDATFGTAFNALGSRTIEIQGRFSF
ncbi:MAG: TonB-dependent receptor domain-containing protein, partial [Terriglobia bacterium]